MDIKTQITLRTKKLGVLIRDARLAARKSVDECAAAIGVKPGVFRAYEQGRRAPSLPELETLVYFLDLPMNHFWGREALSDDEARTAPLDLGQLKSVRQRMIGALLRQERMTASLSLKALAEKTGLPVGRIKAYELGQRPIPLPELEAMLSVLNSRIEAFFDESGPIGRWMTQQKAVEQFLQLPPELQEFVSQPINRPYLELALKLSALSTERLRAVAEGLLDITF